MIDNNILISAFVFGGSIRNNFQKIVAREGIYFLTSIPVKEEIQTVLFREKFLTFRNKADLEVDLSAYLNDAVTIRITQTFTDCRDPKDNKFLDLAVSGQAHFLITGDKDLLVLNPFHGVQIMTMMDFMEVSSNFNA
ncbi:MAG: putative toxin-antitoxin system toxin component, PIN family [SAR324 cluster bacterium]|nr:putative toxin-antitoxin system toxin component, PIN family [SAR324 cluster bacterium]